MNQANKQVRSLLSEENIFLEQFKEFQSQQSRASAGKNATGLHGPTLKGKCITAQFGLANLEFFYAGIFCRVLIQVS
jgi:hypothetical protein